MFRPGQISENRMLQIGIVAVALVLRLVMFPHRDEIRNVDETGYVEGSLALLEGLPAGYKAAPAGPNLWVGWLYAGGVSAWHVVHPGVEEKTVPMQVRPFVAVNHALFDLYHNLIPLREVWIVTQLVLTLWATSAAYRLGSTRAGLAGGLLMGGFFATLPLYVDFTDMSRPYMTSWAFGVLSLNAVVSGKQSSRVLLAAIFLGLAIASRVEMLLLVPVVLWELWFRPEPSPLLKVWAKTLAVTAVTALVAAPWLLTHLIGNLRTIATVRLGPNPQGPTTLAGVLKELAWHQGLAGPMLGFVIVMIAVLLPSGLLRALNPFSSQRARVCILLLGVYVSILLMSLGHGTVFLWQQGPVVLALIAFSVFAVAIFQSRWPGETLWAVGAILLIPLVQTFILTNEYRKAYAADLSTSWVEAHVPAGTRVYCYTRLQNLLPTAEASTALWTEVTDDTAWRKKFASGLSRFGLSADQVPRALSDENLVQERGNRRGLFILGGRSDLPNPRYDIRTYDDSPVFGVQNISSSFASTGGVVISSDGPGSGLGMPYVQYLSANGKGTFIYCSPDVVKLLRP